MVLPLREYFCQVAASDIRDYGFPGTLVDDFLLPLPATDAEWIVTNPPFRLGEQFVTTAKARARLGVAVLVRTAFLESADRHAKLFNTTPPTDILQFVERVPMFHGDGLLLAGLAPKPARLPLFTLNTVSLDSAVSLAA